MKASKDDPIYTTYLISGGVKYHLSPAVAELELSDQKKELAKRATVTLVNTPVSGRWLSSLVKVRDRIFIYADDGERNEEVFRGWVWTRSYKSALKDRELTLKCYDNLVYFQESEESAYFSPGKATKDVLSTLCAKWGVKLDYTYASITHAKLVLRGKLSDIFTEDILDPVQDRTGKKYVILSEQDAMVVKETGTNSTVYAIKAGENAISTRTKCTMDDLVTKVVILGKANDNERRPVEATVSGDTGAYGTLQKLINRSTNTTLADAKKEAQSLLAENGNPTWEYDVKAVDIPWIRKGDKVLINAGDIANATLIVAGVERSISIKGKEMTLTLERP